MASNFLKRKKKEEAEQTLTEVAEEIMAMSDTPDYTHFSYDIHRDADGKTYNGVVVGYNPLTGLAKVVSTSKVTRQIALVFAVHKDNLKLLIK